METGKVSGFQSSFDERIESTRKALVPSEELVYFGECANLRPSVNVIAITSLRVLGVEAAPATGVTETRVKFEARFGDIKSFAVNPGEGREIARWKGRVEVVRADGASMNFVVPRDDVEKIDRCYRATIASEPDSVAASALDGIAPIMTAGKHESKAAAWAAQRATWKARSSNSAAETEALRADAEERAVHDPALHGDVVAEEDFGGMLSGAMSGVVGGKVWLYARGYVRVGTSGSPVEKLMSIKYTEQIGQDKSAGGRAVARFATLGLSDMASNERRDSFLTIATDGNVYTLVAKGSQARMAAVTGRNLEATGQALIEARRSEQTQPTVVQQAALEVGAVDKLKQIAELHRDGILSDDEFAAAKAKLLEQL